MPFERASARRPCNVTCGVAALTWLEAPDDAAAAEAMDETTDASRLRMNVPVDMNGPEQL